MDMGKTEQRSLSKWKPHSASVRRIRIASAVALAILGFSIPSIASAQTVPAFGFQNSWDSSWSYNAFEVHYPLLVGLMFVRQPLAFQLQSSGDSHAQLAQSWQFEGNKLVVTLQPKVKWQIGQDVTSTDVVDTYPLGLATRWAWGGVVTSVSALNAHQVVFTLRTSTLSTRPVPVTHPVVLSEIFGNTSQVVSSSVYDRLGAPKLRSEEATYVTSKAGSTAGTEARAYLALYDKTLTAFDSSGILSGGPDEFKVMTTNEMSLTKNPTFYDASSIHVANVALWNSGARTALSTTEVFARAADFFWPANTHGLIVRWLSSAAHHLAYIPTTPGETFYFNDQYPLNNVKACQAIYYAFNRDALSIAGEGSRGNAFSEFPTGLPSALQQRWLGTNAQMVKEGLNPYPYDPAKARQLLKSAEFTNRKGTWYTSQGAALYDRDYVA